MCTCVSKGRFFGRTLDVETSYDEKPVFIPRRFPLDFRKSENQKTHHAILGMAHIEAGYPLLYDAMNEHGLCMAGLHFPESTVYFPEDPQKDNLAPFELMLWLLGRCSSVAEALPLFARINLWEESFSAALPLTPLHWMLADETQSIAIESCKDGLHIRENPTGVLANEPPLPRQQEMLQEFAAEHRGLGLPGDFTSPTRFQRAAYGRSHMSIKTPEDFFSMMKLVFVPKGCVKVQGRDHYTAYTCCCDREKRSYRCIPYDPQAASAANMSDFDLDGNRLQFLPKKEIRT